MNLDGVPYAHWNDRNGTPRYFWAGLNQQQTDERAFCQCGIDKSCINPFKSATVIHVTCSVKGNLMKV